MFKPVAAELTTETAMSFVEHVDKVHAVEFSDTSSDFSSFAQNFLSSTEMSEEELSENEKRARTDPQLLKPIPGPDLSSVLSFWGEGARDQLAGVLNEYDNLFMKYKADIGKCKVAKHRIELEAEAIPHREGVRRLSPDKAAKANQEVRNLLALGLIQPSYSPWAIGRVMVKKKSGELRFCCDFRSLNVVTVKDAFPLPRLDESLSRIGNAKIFTSIDLAWAFWKIPLKKWDRRKTAFACELGLFKWRRMPFGLCNASATFQRSITRALQAYTGYRRNSQLLVDEATAFYYGMQMGHRSLDELGVRKINDPNERERDHLMIILWYERRDDSTLDKKNHDAKFHKELVSLCKTTEGIKAERPNTTIFPIATMAMDAQPGLGLPTLALLTVLAQDIARQNEGEPTHTYHTWHEHLREPLHQVAERLGFHFPLFLYSISPFWLLTFVQTEYNLDEQQVRLYVEAMEKATMSEVLAYLMAVCLQAVCKGPSALLQKLVLDKGSPYLFSFLIYAQNQKNWLYAIIDALDSAGPLQLKAQLNLNIEALLVWIYSTWVNVAGFMHPLDENPAINGQPNKLPGFLFLP